MFRRTLRKVIPVYAIFPLCMTGLMNLLCYNGAKLMQLLFRFEAMNMTTSWDLALGFHPEWSLVYLAAYFFWFYQYTAVARESPRMACRLAAADATGKIICFLFFLFLPTTNVRPDVSGPGFFNFVMRVIYFCDTPTNLFPSVHCFIAWLGTRYLFECRNLRHKALTCTLCTIGSVLIFFSTIFTCQHVFVDVIAGVAVAEIGWLAARFTPLSRCFEKWNERFMKTKLCHLL